jgi:hypothetical protein
LFAHSFCCEYISEYIIEALDWFHLTGHIPTNLDNHNRLTNTTEFLERIKSKGTVMNGSIREIELTIIRQKNSTPPTALSDDLEAFGIPDIYSISVRVNLVAILRAAG